MPSQRGRWIVPHLLAFISCAMAAGCAARPRAPAEPPGLRQFSRDLPALGTRFRVSCFAPDAGAAATALDAAASRLADLDAALSPDRPDSELSRLCAGAGGPPRKLGDDLFTVIEFAQRVARLSDGAFDVTAAPYLALWRRADEAGAEPADQQLDVVRPLVGWTKMHLDPIERTAALEVPGMKLDPGPLSLGYAADQVLAALAARGAGRAFVETELGPFGRVRRFGAPPPGQQAWGLQLPAPAGSRTHAGTTRPIANAAIASSPPHRLIDPLSGKGFTNRPVVVVVARSGAAAAALATAAAVLGPERGPAVARSAGAEALFDSPVPTGPSGPREKSARKR